MLLFFTICTCMHACSPSAPELCRSVDRSGSKTAEQSGGARKDHCLQWKMKAAPSEESLSASGACVGSQRFDFLCVRNDTLAVLLTFRIRPFCCMEEIC